MQDLDRIEGIPAEARRLWGELQEEPLKDADALRADVLDYAKVIRERASEREFCDTSTAGKLVEVALDLLDLMAAMSHEERRWCQAAIRYFVIEQDGEEDFSSVTGFDDDAEVMNAVLRRIGRTDWIIAID